TYCSTRDLINAKYSAEQPKQSVGAWISAWCFGLQAWFYIGAKPRLILELRMTFGRGCLGGEICRLLDPLAERAVLEAEVLFCYHTYM
ncbi:Hypothetical predicted protein, partial [Podarcis lilfordi]